MKKTGILLLSFFVFILSGCCKHEPPVPVMDFTASVLINYGDSISSPKACTGQITSTNQGMLTLRLQSDDALNNLQYRWDEKLTVSYGDLSFETNADYLPSFSFAQAIYNVLFDLPRNGEFKGFADECALFSGTTQSGEYSLTTDPDGNITEISVKEINLVACFSYDS